jgi:hypothetical protein
MAFACCITIVFAVPAFYLINLKHVWSVCLGQGIFAMSLSLYGSLMAVVMVEQVEDTPPSLLFLSLFSLCPDLRLVSLSVSLLL